MGGVGSTAGLWSTPISMGHELGASKEHEVDELEMAILRVSADLTTFSAALRLSNRIGSSGRNRPGTI